MKRRNLVLIAALSVLAVAMLGGSASAVHFGNNKADLIGTGSETDASGKAILNFVDAGGDAEGDDEFNGNARLTNLVPGGSYTFYANGAGGVKTAVCSGAANAQGTFQCTAQKVAINHGFRSVSVEDVFGNVVARGSFDADPNGQRGNCRFPDQAGSECESNH